ncbi:hypothetical protein [Pseudomonas aeruginosa]|uniref:hypothetical protein n=1 Tax=Pseudomonas aeruginosa TaxID=287 RepID=UPI000FFE7CB2|nr:hypothetical protein [Pseudomonas aeruginosa]
MNIMNVMPQLSLSESGPVNERGESVHFRQGDLDGACGPYSLLMALVTNGIIRREEASYMGLRDGRTRLGKFHNRLAEFGGLISNGTDEFELDWLGECFSRQIEIEIMEGNTRAMVEQLVNAIRQGRSSIVGVDWPGGEGHWLLVVGYQGKLVDQGSDGSKIECTHLLCLDPFCEAPKVSLWNAVLEVQTADGLVPNAGRFPSNYWSGSTPSKCKITNALAILKRR